MAGRVDSQQSCGDQGLPLSYTLHSFVTLSVAAARSGRPPGVPIAQQSCSGQVLIVKWGSCRLQPLLPAEARASPSQQSRSDHGNQWDAAEIQTASRVQPVRAQPASHADQQSMVHQILMQLAGSSSMQDAQQPLANISLLPGLLGQQLGAAQLGAAAQEPPDLEQVRVDVGLSPSACLPRQGMITGARCNSNSSTVLQIGFVEQVAQISQALLCAGMPPQVP